MAVLPSKIEDYALIGDCQTAALVGRNGSIDWLCWPTFDSDACFAALLGTSDNGRWLIAPKEAPASTQRRYRGETLILETKFRCAAGEVTLIDFMPPRGEASDIVRPCGAIAAWCRCEWSWYFDSAPGRTFRGCRGSMTAR